MAKTVFSLFSCFLVFFSCQNAEPVSNSTVTAPDFDQANESSSIIAIIENETACFYARDYECWKAHFAQVDYAFQAWNNADGTFDAKVGWNEVDKKAGQYIKDNPVPSGGSSHPKVERRNMKMKFFNNGLVYMSWDQYNINPAMNAYTHSLETRIMEKIAGVWKIVNVTSYWDYVNLVAKDSLK